MKILSPRIHGFIDYAIVALLVLAPTLFGFGGVAATLCYVAAVAQGGMSLLTAYPLGVKGVIPFPIHGFIELAVGVLFVAAPWLFGFADDVAARNFFLVSGASVGVVFLLTNYRATERAGDRGVIAHRYG